MMAYRTVLLKNLTELVFHSGTAKLLGSKQPLRVFQKSDVLKASAFNRFCNFDVVNPFLLPPQEFKMSSLTIFDDVIVVLDSDDDTFDIKPQYDHPPTPPRRRRIIAPPETYSSDSESNSAKSFKFRSRDISNDDDDISNNVRASPRSDYYSGSKSESVEPAGTKSSPKSFVCSHRSGNSSPRSNHSSCGSIRSSAKSLHSPRKSDCLSPRSGRSSNTDFSRSACCSPGSAQFSKSSQSSRATQSIKSVQSSSSTKQTHRNSSTSRSAESFSRRSTRSRHRRGRSLELRRDPSPHILRILSELSIIYNGSHRSRRAHRSRRNHRIRNFFRRIRRSLRGGNSRSRSSLPTFSRRSRSFSRTRSRSRGTRSRNLSHASGSSINGGFRSGSPESRSSRHSSQRSSSDGRQEMEIERTSSNGSENFSHASCSPMNGGVRSGSPESRSSRYSSERNIPDCRQEMEIERTSPNGSQSFAHASCSSSISESPGNNSCHNNQRNSPDRQEVQNEAGTSSSNCNSGSEPQYNPIPSDEVRVVTVNNENIEPARNIQNEAVKGSNSQGQANSVPPNKDEPNPDPVDLSIWTPAERTYQFLLGVPIHDLVHVERIFLDYLNVDDPVDTSTGTQDNQSHESNVSVSGFSPAVEAHDPCTSRSVDMSNMPSTSRGPVADMSRKLEKTASCKSTASQGSEASSCKSTAPQGSEASSCKSTAPQSEASSCKSIASQGSGASSSKSTASQGSEASSSKSTASQGSEASSSKSTAPQGSEALSSKSTAPQGSEASSCKSTASQGSGASSSKSTASQGSEASSSKSTAPQGSEASSSKSTAPQGSESSSSKRSAPEDSKRPSKRPRRGDFNFHNGNVTVYTDGACTGNGTDKAKAGIGVWFGDNHPRNLALPLKGKATNNRAEIIACIVALEILKAEGFHNIYLYCDSELVINSINLWIPRWKTKRWKTANNKPVKNQMELKRLLAVSESLSVHWFHVAAHTKIKGNEEADKLARKGAERYVPGIDDDGNYV